MKRKRTRRPQGDGSIFKYRNGYAAVLDLGWAHGKRQRRWVYGRTESAVLDRMYEMRRQLTDGVSFAQPPRTLTAWMDEWLDLKSRAGTRPSTLRSYRWLIESHIRPELGRAKLADLTPTMIRRLLEAKLATGLSTGTVRHIHSLLRNLLSDAQREELVARNVAKLVRPPALNRPERRALTQPEARHLLEVIQGDRFEAAWVCALSLGLRRAELLGLRWVDIDFDHGTLAVRQTLQRSHGRLEFSPPKTDRSARLIPVPAAVLDHMERHRDRQDAERLARGTGWTENGLVFPSAIGTPLEPRNLDRAWQIARHRAGLDWLRLHDLRHACATFLLLSGASPRTVMQTLGHSQISLTMNTYAHVLPEVERAALDEAAHALFGDTGGDRPHSSR